MGPSLEHHAARTAAHGVDGWVMSLAIGFAAVACAPARPASASPVLSRPNASAPAPPKRKPWSEAMQTLHFDSVYGPLSALWGGNYELVVAGPAYAAKCSFWVADPSDATARNAPHWGQERCTGDEVYLLWGVWSVMGITLPKRLSAVRVRLVRGQRTLYDGTVTRAPTSCGDFVAASEESGVCVFVEPDH
jgi:hypothetical protein